MSDTPERGTQALLDSDIIVIEGEEHNIDTELTPTMFAPTDGEVTPDFQADMEDEDSVIIDDESQHVEAELTPTMFPPINNEPAQGIRAQLDLLYLWNPDVAEDLIEKLEESLALVEDGKIKPYEELLSPIKKYTACTHGDYVYVANTDIQEKPEEFVETQWTLIATRKTDIEFDYITTKTVGGLPANTNITDWSLEKVMKQMLAPTAMKEPTLTLSNIASTEGVAGSTHTFNKDTVVATISWSAGTSTNPGAYTLTGTGKDKLIIDGTNVKLKEAETFIAGTTSAITFGVSRTYDIVNEMGQQVSGTASDTGGSLKYSATYPSYIGVTEATSDSFIDSVTSAISLPSTFEQKATQNSAFKSYTIPDKQMMTYTNRFVIINKGKITKIEDSNGGITENFKIETKTLTLIGNATAEYGIAVQVNPSGEYQETLTIS